jgi:HTH-type transcriptional regulator/antitoxin HipB
MPTDAFLLQAPAQLKLHLRALRRERGLTQAALAARLGIKQARYAIIESRPEAVSTGQLLDILAALGVDVLLRPRRARPEDARTRATGEDW